MAKASLKGQSLLDTMSGMKARIGAERFRAFVQGLPLPTREVLENPILAYDWYPLEVMTSLVEAHVADYFAGDVTVVRRHAEQLFDKQLRGIYRLFI